MAGRGLGRDASWDVCLALWDFVNVAMGKKNTPWCISLPIGSMYGIYANIWGIYIYIY